MKERRMCLTTGRLVMKPLSPEDRERFLQIGTDERIRATYMFPEFDTPEQADAFFERIRKLSLSEERFVYGICRNGELIGFLNDCEISGGTVELGYFIAPEHWNRGYAAEALGAAVQELFRLGYACVRAGYFEGNEASRRVMEKCGMRPVPLVQEIEYRGVRRRCLYYESGNSCLSSGTEAGGGRPV